MLYGPNFIGLLVVYICGYLLPTCLNGRAWHRPVPWWASPLHIRREQHGGSSRLNHHGALWSFPLVPLLIVMPQRNRTKILVSLMRVEDRRPHHRADRPSSRSTFSAPVQRCRPLTWRRTASETGLNFLHLHWTIFLFNILSTPFIWLYTPKKIFLFNHYIYLRLFSHWSLYQ